MAKSALLTALLVPALPSSDSFSIPQLEGSFEMTSVYVIPLFEILQLQLTEQTRTFLIIA
jgi:hypothetical protein